MLFRFCNALMGMNFSMLGDETKTDTSASEGAIIDSAKQIKNILQTIINVILGLATLAVVIYAIVLAVQFLRADSAEKREEAKKRLIYAIIGLVAAVVVIVVVNFVASNILDWVGIKTGETGKI